MVKRFGSGQATRTTENKVNRGAPVVRRSDSNNQEVILQQQKSKLESDLQSSLNRLEELNKAVLDNNPVGGSIVSRSKARQLQAETGAVNARIGAIREALNLLNQGQSFSNFSDAQSFITTREQQARSAQQAKISDAISRKRAREVAKPKKKIVVSDQFQTANILTEKDVEKRREELRSSGRQVQITDNQPLDNSPVLSNLLTAYKVQKNLYGTKEGRAFVSKTIADTKLPFKSAGLGATPEKTLLARETLNVIFKGRNLREESKSKRGQTAFKSRILGNLLPETIGESALLGASVFAFGALPSAGRIAASAGISGLSGFAAVEPGLTPEQRISSGLISVAGGFGAISEAAPFIRGGIFRLTNEFKPVTRSESTLTAFEKRLISSDSREGLFFKDTFQKVDVGNTQIGLIPPGKGFGFETAIQESFIGKNVKFATSQANLIKQPFSSSEAITIIGEGEGGLGLFLTPSINFPLARTSRLGGIKGLFESGSLGSDLRVGFPPKPQIIFGETMVTSSGTQGTARGIGFPSSELEITFLPTAKTGQALKTEFAGVTTIKGIGVELFKGNLVPVSETSPTLVSLNSISRGSRTQINTVSGEGAISTSISTSRQLTGVIRSDALISPSYSISDSPPSTISISRDFPSPISTPPSAPSSPSSPPSSPSTPISGGSLSPSPPSLPTTTRSPPSSPPSPPTIPTTTRSPPSTPRPPPTTPNSSKLGGFPRLKARPRSKQSTGLFQVFGRRYGKFNPIGTARTARGAVKIGANFARTTLGATFKVAGLSNVSTPSGFYSKSTKGGTLFIERRSLRLNTVTEVTAIGRAKKKKKKKRKVNK